MKALITGVCGQDGWYPKVTFRALVRELVEAAR